MYLNRDESFFLRLLREIAALEQVRYQKHLVTLMPTQSVYLQFVEIIIAFLFTMFTIYLAPKAFNCTDFYFIYCYIILKYKGNV